MIVWVVFDDGGKIDLIFTSPAKAAERKASREESHGGEWRVEAHDLFGSVGLDETI